MGLLVGLTVLPEVLRSLPQEDYGRLQFAIAVQLWVITVSGKNILEGAKRGIAKGLDGTLLFALKRRVIFLLRVGVLGAALWQAAPLAAGTCLAGGTFYGLVTWMVAAGGDSYQASGNYLGMLGFLLAIGLLGSRPFEPASRRSGGVGYSTPNKAQTR